MHGLQTRTSDDHAGRGATSSRRRARDADRGFAADQGPSLPERLHAARERKGVDLYRAERDTKIRARYLAALEAGDYAELPGAVYTKGFLRNYALYLGLDPEDVIRQWKRERGDTYVPAEPVLAVPRPLEAPRQGLTFSPIIVVAALLTVLIGVFAVYIGVQLVRFAKPPTIAVTTPATAVVEVGEDTSTYTLKGTSLAGATITIAEAGARAAVPRLGGRRRPLDLGGPAPAGPQRVHGQRRGPRDGQAVRDDGAGVHHRAVPRHRGPDAQRQFAVGGGPVPERRDPGQGVDDQREDRRRLRGAHRAGGWPARLRRAKPGAKPVTVGPKTVEVASDGTFETPLDLSTGKWQITVTATSAEGKAVTLTRNVAIVYKGVNLVVDIKGGRAWIKVWVDGKVSKVTGTAGRVYSRRRR